MDTLRAAYALTRLPGVRSCVCANAAASGQKAEGRCLLTRNSVKFRLLSFAVISMYWGSTLTTSVRIRLCWRSWSKNSVRSVTRKVVNKLISRRVLNRIVGIVFVEILDGSGSDSQAP